MAQQTAYNLFIHPKTLRYRLRRIEEIVGGDPFSKDQQLSFYIATKLARLVNIAEQR
jgi:DNA-binding PucR family transcriptional regulator